MQWGQRGKKGAEGLVGGQEVGWQGLWLRSWLVGVSWLDGAWRSRAHGGGARLGWAYGRLARHKIEGGRSYQNSWTWCAVSSSTFQEGHGDFRERIMHWKGFHKEEGEYLFSSCRE